MKPRLALLLIFVCAISLAAQEPAAKTENQELTISAIFAEGSLTGRAPESIKWSPDGSKVSFVQRDDTGERGELWYVDAASGNKAVLVTAEKLSLLSPPSSRINDERLRDNRQRYSVAAYQWAPDSRHLLFDSFGQLWLHSLDTGTAVQVTSSGEPSSDPKFSPDGKRLAFVRKHNLYVRSVNGREETQLTKDGSDELLNGEVDWVYAEELDVRSNYFWSPDGEQIVLLQMDEKPVPTYPLTDFIPTRPRLDTLRYPKAGDPNPVVRVGVVDSDGGKVKWLTVGDRDEKDIYIPRFGWVRPGLVWVQVLNRAQNKLDLYFVDARSGRSRRMLTETSDAWVEVNDDFRVLKSGDRFLWSSWRDGHTHLYLYGFDPNNPLSSDAQPVHQVTRGEFEVFSVSAVDEEAGRVYFLANAGDVRQRNLFSVKFDGTDMARVSKEDGSHAGSFAPNAAYYVDSFSALMTPPRLAMCRAGGACNTFWESRALGQYRLLTPQFLEFQAEDGTVLHGLLLMPPEHFQRVKVPMSEGIRASAKTSKLVPLIMNAYGGPSGQVVRNAWGGANFLYHQVLAQRGFAILQVDNRGMAARGRKFAAASRLNLGQIEVKDQLAALQQALQRFPVLDGSRVGFWGWSYGGYLTTHAMTHSDAFLAGVAVAPVTDWRSYDTIYTERYMGLPKENAEGYNQSSCVQSAKDLSGKLLLVHGTGDDNVHMQNTLQLANALIEAGKQFDLMLYPRKTHAISGSAARTHLFTRMRRHFEQTLLAKPETKAPLQRAEN